MAKKCGLLKKNPYGDHTSPRATWKRFENDVAKYFGGRRTPLSGMNSQHGTSSDVIWPDGTPNSPRNWLYIEIKRSQHFNKSITKFYTQLRGGMIGIESTPEGMEGPQRFFLWLELKRYVFFEQYLKSPFELMETSGFLWQHMGHKFQYSPGVKLLLESQEKAKKEGKDVTICCFRYHGKHGYVMLIEFGELARLNAWLVARFDGEKRVSTLTKGALSTFKKADSSLEEKRRSRERKRASLGLIKHLEEESPTDESSKSSESQGAERQP